MMSMSLLDFRERLPLDSNQKSLQNLLSYSLNMVNQPFLGKALKLMLLKLSKGLYKIYTLKKNNK